MGRRSYAGAANHLALAAPYNVGDPTFTTDSPIGWPDGANGPFQVRIAKGAPNEQKVLVASRTGATFTVSIAAWDGTIATNHSASESVEIIGSSVDFDEANAHVNASLAVHGLASGVHPVGDTTTQTLTGKTMSGSANTFTNIPRSASPEIDAALTANAATDVTTAAAVVTETNRATAAETANTALVTAETARATGAETTLTTSVATNATAIAAETTRATAAEALKAPIATPTFTGIVTMGGDLVLNDDTPDTAHSATSKTYVDGKFKAGASTLTPDANGNLTITHTAGYTPTVVQLTLLGPNTGNAAATTVLLRALGSPTITARVFAPDGTPFSGSNVTIHWVVYP